MAKEVDSCVQPAAGPLVPELAPREGVFLAYKVNGQVSPRKHGYPLRLMVQGKYSTRWVKWLVRIEVR